MQYRQRQGFTLVEVLIALAIIAIACTAIVKAVSDSVRVTTDLERHAVESWVASNVLADIQNGVLPLPKSDAPTSGHTKMLHLPWHWEATSEQAGTPGSLSIVTVAVAEGARKKASFHLTGYVWVSNPMPRGANA